MSEMIHDDYCPWPFYQPYGLVVAPKPPKIRRPHKQRSRAAKRSWIAVDLATPKYHQRVVPNKKRKLNRSKVTLGGDE